jgi:hypothetical protein
MQFLARKRAKNCINVSFCAFGTSKNLISPLPLPGAVQKTSFWTTPNNKTNFFNAFGGVRKTGLPNCKVYTPVPQARKKLLCYAVFGPLVGQKLHNPQNFQCLWQSLKGKSVPVPLKKSK